MTKGPISDSQGSFYDYKNHHIPEIIKPARRVPPFSPPSLASNSASLTIPAGK